LKCPDCNQLNRSFDEYCIKCGANLYKLKHQKNKKELYPSKNRQPMSA